jgi:hypothetical protein
MHARILPSFVPAATEQWPSGTALQQQRVIANPNTRRILIAELRSPKYELIRE